VKFLSVFLCVTLLTACRPSDALPTLALLPTTQAVMAVSSMTPTDPSVEEVLPPLPRSAIAPTASTTLESTQKATQTPDPTATITETATITPTLLPLDIDFERVYPIDLPLRAPLMAALNEDRTGMIETRYTLTTYKTRDGWLKMLLVPTLLIDRNWQAVETLRDQFVEVVGWQADGQWQMARIGSTQFEGIRTLIPESLIARTMALPPLAGSYLFPWAKGQAWWAIQSWHDGYALDFQPVTGQRNSVLAAESGWLREVCGDGYQSFLELQHADGRSTFYLHVKLPRRIRALLDHPVQRGQYLGELINQAHFATDCGRGLSRHLHFVTSDPQLIVDGYTLSDIAGVASCCASPPIYVSSNQKHDITQE
jgi:hypothetical protein